MKRLPNLTGGSGNTPFLAHIYLHSKKACIVLGCDCFDTEATRVNPNTYRTGAMQLEATMAKLIYPRLQP